MLSRPPRWLLGVGLLVAAAIIWFGLGMHRGLLLSEDIRSRLWPWAPFFPKRELVAPALSDPVKHFVPWLAMVRRELVAGRLPLWNPHQDGGVPLLGNGQTSMGSPLLWPVLAFGVAAGWNLSLLLRCLVAFVGAFLWLRDLGRSEVAAGVGGVAFALSGPMIAWLEIIGPTAAPVPLLLFFARRAARAPTRGSLVGVAAATYLVLSGAHPETEMMAALLAAAVTLRSVTRARALTFPVGAALLGVGLTAPFLFTFAHYFFLSEARLGIDRHPFVLPLKDLLRFLGRDVAGSNVIEAASTVSVTVLVLAAAGLWLARRDPDFFFWTFVAATMLLITYDNPVARAFSMHTPVYWTRALLFLPLPLGYLASGAIDELDRLAHSARWPTLGFAVGCVALIAASAELLVAAQGVNGHSKPSELAPSTPLLDALQADHGVFRVLPLHTFLPPNTATDYGLDDVRGYDALGPRGWRRQREALGRFSNTPTLQGVLEPWDLAQGGKSLDFWNVKYLLLHPQFGFGPEAFRARKGLDLETVYSGPDGQILRNNRVLPRLRLSVPGSVTLRQRLATRWDIETDAALDGVFLLADPFFPGWRVTVDGKDVPLRLDPGDPITFPIAAGHHRVQIVFSPASFRWGLAVMVASIVGLLLLSRLRQPR